MPQSINLYEAKTNLSKLVERAAAGEEFIIAKSGRPLARLAPLQKQSARRTPGLLKGKINIAANFDDPMPDDIARVFRGELP